MNSGKTVLAQILDALHPEEFRRIARRHPTSRDTHALSAYDHFVAMIFAQLTYRESLRDIEACLGSKTSLLYHSGIRSRITRGNLSYANEHRPAALFAEVAMLLMRRARRLYAGTANTINIGGEIYAIDSTLVELSLALFPWARWQGTHAALKLNVLLNVATEIPEFCTLVDGGVSDFNFLDVIYFIAGAYYVIDRGYLDFKRLFRITQAGAWFVTRLKSNIHYYVAESRSVNKEDGVISDQIIRLSGAKARKGYPDQLRRIHYYDKKSGNDLVFLTNNFILPALIIALIYKRRWEIELFFKWIKQHLRLRGFYSTNRNGVSVQIWTALCAYLLVAIMQRTQSLTGTLYRTLQIISISTFEKVPLHQLVAKIDTRNEDVYIPNQLTFNGF